LTALNWISVGLILISSIGLLLSRDWRWSLAILAVQYSAVFWLVQLTWPIGMAAVKLLTGWMVCVILGIAELSAGHEEEDTDLSWPQGRVFRLLISGLVVLVSVAIVPSLVNWLGVIGHPRAWGSMLLMGMGFLQLGTTTGPLRVVIGLLTVFSGFEIIYAAVETSILVAALMAVVNLGLAMIGAYLIPKGDGEFVQ
jgi:hypothetical protein